MFEKGIAAQCVRLSIEKAWLAGLIAGDGHVHYSEEGRRYALEIAAGWDEPLAHEAAAVIRSVYGLESRVHKVDRAPPRTFCWMTSCFSKALVEDLHLVAPFGIYRWRVPDLVKQGSPEVRAAWVAGFVDAEGHVRYVQSKGVRYVAIASVNKEGMAELAELLRGLGIRNATYFHTRPDAAAKNLSEEVKIHVGDRAALTRFAEIVPLRCPRKVARLAAAVSTYTKSQALTETLETHVEQIEQLLLARASYEQIGYALSLDPEKVRWIARTRSLSRPGRGHGERYQFYDSKWPTVLELIGKGMTIGEIASEIGTTEERLKNAMRKRGTKVGERRGRESKRGAELEALLPQIRELVAQGLSNPQIVETVGHDLSRQRLANLMSKHGIKRDPSRRWIRSGPASRRE